MDTQPNLMSLPEATAEKLQLYKQCFSPDNKVPFWDIVVLTAGNETQKESYQQQIELRKARKEIPTSVRYLVFSDPPGAKIGAGGATMHVLQQMEQTLGWEEMQKSKVLLVHAGGYSQRLANVSAIGKVFMSLPCGEPVHYQMLDIVLIMWCDLPARMNPGVFLVAADIILLYNGRGDWNMRGPGVTAIAHPAPIDLCTNHGVFVFEDVNKIRKRYDDDPSKPASMADVQRFLHKSTQKTVTESGARIANTNQVYVDLAYWFDYVTAKKLIKFYSDNQPLECEIDAYGDFLQALGPDATPDYCGRVGHVSDVTSSLVDMRRKVFELLRDTPFRAVVFNQADFNHVGTTKEYVHHLCFNKSLIDSFQFTNETGVRYVSSSPEEGMPSDKKQKMDKFQDCAIMSSTLNDRDSIQIGSGSVVEYCTIGHGVDIGSNCIVSGLSIPANTVIPKGSFLHTIPVTIENKTCYATFAFDISDSMKTSTDVSLELPYCSQTMESALSRLFADYKEIEVWPKEANKHCLWNARLFPALPSRELSSVFAINMIKCLKDSSQNLCATLGSRKVLSVYEMIQAKSLTALLSYYKEFKL